MKKVPVLSTEAEISRALRDINPLWANENWPDLPVIRRFPFHIATRYLQELGSQRAIFLRGFRGVGKSTLLRQMGNWLKNEREVEAKNIVYVDFEKRPLRQIAWNAWFDVWENTMKPSQGQIYFLLDEIQYAGDWTKEVRSLLVNPRYRVVATGSAAAEIQTALDEEVRRWISLHVPTLLFYEYLLIFEPNESSRLENDILRGQAFFEKNEFDAVILSNLCDILEPHFQKYLLRGGFPETAGANLTLSQIQNVLTDVVDKALYQDMRTQFSRHDIENLERLLEYICRNPGALLDKSKVSETLEVSRPTAARYVKALEDGDFIRVLSNQNRGGKKALKAKPRLYPVDASLRNAILGRTEDVLNQPDEMGHIVEGTIAAHLGAFTQTQGGQLGYWRKKDKEEIDFRLEKTDAQYWVVESKYGQPKTNWLNALRQWPAVEQKRVSACFLVSRYKTESGDQTPSVEWPLRCRLNVIPAPVFLYLIGRELWIKASSFGSPKAKTGAVTGQAKIQGDTSTTTGTRSTITIKTTLGE